MSANQCSSGTTLHEHCCPDLVQENRLLKEEVERLEFNLTDLTEELSDAKAWTNRVEAGRDHFLIKYSDAKAQVDALLAIVRDFLSRDDGEDVYPSLTERARCALARVPE